MLELQPITQREAYRFIAEHHRHHEPPRGDKFCIAINDGHRVVGVISVGRPVARMLDDGYTGEVTRCCVLEGVKNGSSKLYAAAWRAARAMGYRRLITYTPWPRRAASRCAPPAGARSAAPVAAPGHGRRGCASTHTRSDRRCYGRRSRR